MIGALALFVVGLMIGQARGRAAANRPRVAGAPSSARGPLPMTVLADFVQRGVTPPPIVVGHAIAQAELAGEHRLAHQIVRAFVPKPVIDAVYSDGADRDDSGLADQGRPSDLPAPMHEGSEIEIGRGGGGGGGGGRGFSGFGAQSMPLVDLTGGDGDGSNVQIGRAAHAQQPASPLPGVPDDAWLMFQHALANRPIAYTTDRRVGRYEQRKDRLRELGCDPDVMIQHARAADLQDAALALDIADAAAHLDQSGTMDDYIGTEIELPDGTHHRMTLSGLLGLAQVAGLEGCVSWLEHAEDRVRFPHNASVFQRTNGVF